MSDPLEAELDGLFQQLPAAHVEARDALAARLRKAGKRAEADRVKKLKRPSVAAWAINQLHFRQPALLAAARDAAAALRALHARDGTGPSEFNAAVTAQRRAVQAAIDGAVRDGEQTGLAIGSVDQRRLETSLQAWLTGAGDEAPGRMTHDLEASGFEAVSVVGIASPRKPRAAEDADAEPPAPAQPLPAQASLPLSAAAPSAPQPDIERIARARGHLRNREKELEAARAHAEKLQHDLSAASTTLEQTRARVREAEQALSALTKQQRQEEANLLTTRTESRQADASLQSAERAVSQARADLARIQPVGDEGGPNARSGTTR